MWVLTACLSAFFAGITSILIKCGVKNTDSDVATALRTGVVLVFAAIMAIIAGKLDTICSASWEEFVFLALSGISTGISWLCYSKAIATGDVNKVTPVDKSSTILTVLIAIVAFNETSMLWLKLVCIAFIFVGTIFMIEKKPVPATYSPDKNTICDGSVLNNESLSNDTNIDTNITVSTKQDKKATGFKNSWLFFALLSCIFAALTSVFAKIGIKTVESNLGTALRTVIVLIISWIIVLAKKKVHLVKTVKKKDLLFLILSGITTGASWLCYYSAIQTGVVSVVVPIDKLSILITVAFSVVFLKEKLSLKAWIGLAMIVSATIIMAVFT